MWSADNKPTLVDHILAAPPCMKLIEPYILECVRSQVGAIPVDPPLRLQCMWLDANARYNIIVGYYLEGRKRPTFFHSFRLQSTFKSDLVEYALARM